jgi:hypothetical protein
MTAALIIAGIAAVATVAIMLMTYRSSAAETVEPWNAGADLDGYWERAATSRGTALLRANAQLVDQANEIERLQRALCFWLPHVPEDDDEIADRSGNDAMLLCGYQGDFDDCAESRGWYSLRHVPGTIERWHGKPITADTMPPLSERVIVACVEAQGEAP